MVHASMELDVRVQALARAAQGPPVPAILAASNSVEPLGNPYLICIEIAGETIVGKIGGVLDGRYRLAKRCRVGARRVRSR